MTFYRIISFIVHRFALHLPGLSHHLFFDNRDNRSLLVNLQYVGQRFKTLMLNLAAGIAGGQRKEKGDAREVEKQSGSEMICTR